MANFEVGKEYWGIRTGYGFDRITQVRLTKELFHNGVLAGYESKDVGKGTLAGSCGIQLIHLFYTKAEAENYRDQMANVRVEEIRKNTDTPEKMLKYLLDRIDSEYDGYCDGMVNEDIRKRARELFGVKSK